MPPPLSALCLASVLFDPQVVYFLLRSVPKLPQALLEIGSYKFPMNKYNFRSYMESELQCKEVCSTCPHPCLLVLPESGGSVGNKKGQPLGQVRLHSREEAAVFWL